MEGFRGPFAATRAAEKIAEMLSEKDFDQVIVKYRGAGGNRSNRPQEPRLRLGID